MKKAFGHHSICFEITSFQIYLIDLFVNFWVLWDTYYPDLLHVFLKQELVALAIQLVVIAIGFYWWVVVNSHYRNLRRGVISAVLGGVSVPENVALPLLKML